MKTKLGTKVLTGLFAFALILGTASFASAKGPDKGTADQKKQEQPILDKKVDEQKTISSDKKSVEEQTGKTENKKGTSKKETKKKDAITSKAGTAVEKRLTSSETAIKNITHSINSYFGVSEDGTTDKDLSKKVADSKYNSFKGKLNAEINKLQAIDKQLSSNKKKYKSVTEIDALVAKSQELQQLALDEIDRVKALAVEASAPKSDDGTDETTTPGDTTTPTGTTDPTTGTTDPTTGTTDPTTGTTDPTATPTVPAV